MNNVKRLLRSKRFIAAALITAVTVGVIVMQKKAKTTGIMVQFDEED